MAPAHPNALSLQAQLREQQTRADFNHTDFELLTRNLQHEIRELSQHPLPILQTEPEGLQALQVKILQLRQRYTTFKLTWPGLARRSKPFDKDVTSHFRARSHKALYSGPHCQDQKRRN